MNLNYSINQVQHVITRVEAECGRNAGSVLLLAVSKQQSAQTIRDAFHLGIRNFGESYFQEALPKINELKDLPLCWHFIGPIQSNKTKGIASSFNWVHSLNRSSIARQLHAHRPHTMDPINICIQVNLVDEQTKAGIAPEDVAELALEASQLPNLKLRGLMTIPPPQKDPQHQYDLFLRLNQLMHSLNQEHGLGMDTLSMGMSDDLIPAIKAGSTIVRVGRALFGERQR